jgi:hypothetical protein
LRKAPVPKVILTFPGWNEVEPKSDEDWSAMLDKIGIEWPGKMRHSPKCSPVVPAN